MQEFLTPKAKYLWTKSKAKLILEDIQQRDAQVSKIQAVKSQLQSFKPCDFLYTPDGQIRTSTQGEIYTHFKP